MATLNRSRPEQALLAAWTKEDAALHEAMEAAWPKNNGADHSGGA